MPGHSGHVVARAWKLQELPLGTKAESQLEQRLIPPTIHPYHIHTAVTTMYILSSLPDSLGAMMPRYLADRTSHASSKSATRGGAYLVSLSKVAGVEFFSSSQLTVRIITYCIISLLCSCFRYCIPKLESLVLSGAI